MRINQPGLSSRGSRTMLRTRVWQQLMPSAKLKLMVANLIKVVGGFSQSMVRPKRRSP